MCSFNCVVLKRAVLINHYISSTTLSPLPKHNHSTVMLSTSCQGTGRSLPNWNHGNDDRFNCFSSRCHWKKYWERTTTIMQDKQASLMLANVMLVVIFMLSDRLSFHVKCGAQYDKRVIYFYFAYIELEQLDWSNQNSLYHHYDIILCLIMVMFKTMRDEATTLTTTTTTAISKAQIKHRIAVGELSVCAHSWFSQLSKYDQ